MGGHRALIVNADDFGRSERTNAGIIEAHERGIVTSASLMVRCPAAASAAGYARGHRTLSVGLHVDLDTWSRPPEPEVLRQLERFRALVGADPTHLDSHHHVHRVEPVASLLISLSRRLRVPLREHSPIRYCGDFYGRTADDEPAPDAIAPDALIALVARLPPGVTELGCHPGLDTELDSSYREERLLEVQTLCDPRLRAALEREGVELRSFAAGCWPQCR